MANEKRLIDANALIEEMKECAITRQDLYCNGYAQAFIENAPTVDAVEVVRCKNCRDCEMCYPEKRLDKEATQAWICNRYKRYCKPDDFCSYGERRTDDG